jgi:hypothetical protein
LRRRLERDRDVEVAAQELSPDILSAREVNDRRRLRLCIGPSFERVHEQRNDIGRAVNVTRPIVDALTGLSLVNRPHCHAHGFEKLTACRIQEERAVGSVEEGIPERVFQQANRSRDRRRSDTNSSRGVA